MASPGGPDLGPTATDWSNWMGHMAGMLHELTWTYWASISAARALKGLFAPIPSVLWPHFGPNSNFGWNIGMWGDQSVAIKRPAHTVLLQPFWNYPARENS